MRPLKPDLLLPETLLAGNMLLAEGVRTSAGPPASPLQALNAARIHLPAAATLSEASPCGGELVPIHGWGQILPSPSCNAGVRDLGFSLPSVDRHTQKSLWQRHVCQISADLSIDLWRFASQPCWCPAGQENCWLSNYPRTSSALPIDRYRIRRLCLAVGCVGGVNRACRSDSQCAKGCSTAGCAFRRSFCKHCD